MSFALVNHVISGTNSNGTTSSGIDTTGANLIVIGSASYSIVGQPTITDSKGNTWTGLTTTDSSVSRIRIWYCENPTVGSGHTFTSTITGGYPTVAVLAFSGGKSSSFDQENGAGSATPGSVTPSEDNEMLCAFMMADSPGVPTGVSINASFTFVESVANSSGNYFGLASAYQIQTTATARNPTFSYTGGSGVASRIATFKAAAAAGNRRRRVLLGVA